MNNHKQKFYVCACILSMLSIWGFLGFQYHYDSTQAQRAVETNVSNLSKAFEENIVGAVRNIDELLLDLRRDFSQHQNQFTADISSFNRHSDVEFIIQASILNADGILIYSSREKAVKQINLSDREHFRVHLDNSEDSLFISKPIKGRVSQKLSIQFTRKLLHQDGTFAGVMVLSVDPEYFSNFYRSINIGPHGVITLLGMDGIIRARSSEATKANGAVGTVIPRTNLLLDVTKPPVGIYIAPSVIDGISRIVSYRRLKNYPLVVRVAVAEDDAFTSLHWHRTSIIVQGILATAGLLLALWLALRLNAHQQLLTHDLQESRQHFADIINFLPDATYAIDSENRVIIWNRAMEELTGVCAADIIGQGDHAYALPFYGERRKQLLDLQEEENSAFESGYRNIRRTGNNLCAEVIAPALHGGKGAHLLVTCAPLYGTNGQRIGAIESVRDITHQKQNEQILVSREEELKSILESIPVGIAWSNANGTVEYLNSSFVQRFGYNSDDIRSFQDWLDNAYPDSEHQNKLRQIWSAEHARSLTAHSSVVTMATDVTCKNGEIRKVLINTHLSPGRVLAIFTDITEREQYYHSVIKVQKLESLGVLAGGIAHDFNNILTGIMGNLSLAQKRVGEQHRAFHPLLQAEKASHRASELAYQLLTFSKGGKPVIKSVSTQQLLEESISLVLHGANVKAELHCVQDLHHMFADPGQISQVFNNVIINALQAMPSGGILSVTTCNINLSEINPFRLSPGDYVRITLTDQGCGIPPENLQKIFDPYFTTKSSGTGLGLASAHSIITQHSGYIGVESTPGAGTSFDILLPAADSAELAHTAHSTFPGSEHNQGKAILVMDDEEVIRSIAIEILDELGYIPQTCINGDEAVQMYLEAMQAQTPFAAVIMDLTIPGGMGGKEAAEQIRAIDPAACLIVSSGYSSDTIMAEHAKYGFCAALPKPYRALELAQVLNATLV